MNWSRIGNSIFFTGLVLLALAGVVWSGTESSASHVAMAIGALAVALMVLGGWLWNRPVPVSSQSLPLSQRLPRNKILAGVGGLVLLLAMSFQDQEPDKLRHFTALILVAYGMAGVVEMHIDRRFPTAKARFDALAAGPKILLSTLVIIGASVAAMFIVILLFRPA